MLYGAEVAAGDLPTDFAEVVRPHFDECDGVVVASSGQCLEIQAKEEEQVPGRDFSGVRPEDLPGLELEESWLVGILLCPGDETEEVSTWASTLDPTDLDRVRFYYTPDVDLVDAFGAWYEEGLPDPRTAEVEGWEDFHQTFGRDHSNQVYRDVQEHSEWFEG